MLQITSKTRTQDRLRVTSTAGAIAAAIVTCITAGSASAASNLPRFHMQAALDGPGGKLIADGQYAAAVQLLESDDGSVSRSSRMSHYTNLCVSRTLTERADMAVDSCSQAIENADVAPTPYLSMERSNNALAVLYSNRAVAYWRAGNTTAAEADLAMATKLSPRFDSVKDNEAAFAARRQMLTASNE